MISFEIHSMLTGISAVKPRKTNPRIVSSGLDCHTIFSTIDTIKAAGTTVLLVEQNANAALQHSDRGYVLETGAVTLEGQAAAIASDPRVRKAYLGE